jgi:hypothetical protein
VSNPDGLCVITAVLDGHEQPLTTHLRGLPGGARSPMIRVRGTHYARWTVVHLEGTDGKPLASEPSHLLFASEFDGEVEPYARRLCVKLGREAHDIWGHCEGYPGDDPEALAGFLLAHRVEPGYSVCAYPRASVDDVRESFALRERLNDFMVRASKLEGEALQRAWTQRFRGGDR